jgi:hypothetical protein
VDPDTDTDPDPAYQVNPIRIQSFDDQKLKKTAPKFFLSYFYLKLLFTYNQATEAFSSQKRTHCKKELAIFPSPAGMSLTKLSLGGKKLKYSRPGRV